MCSKKKIKFWSLKVDWNRSQNHSKDKVQNLGKNAEGKYAKFLTKIQVTAIFLKQDMQRNVLPTFLTNMTALSAIM